MADQPAISPNNTFANIVGSIITGFLCATTGYLVWKVLNAESDISDKVINIVIYILGFLTAKIGTIVDWCFGGSSATKRQGEIIATQANTIASAQDKLAPVPGATPTIPVAPGGAVTVKGTESPTE
jgi:hypothetical protein